jgi:hypothetical protein
MMMNKPYREYDTAEAHIAALEQERDHLRMAAESEAKRGDELAARVIELELSSKALIGQLWSWYSSRHETAKPGWVEPQLDKFYQTYNNKPPASLKLHDAEVLEEAMYLFGKPYFGVSNADIRDTLSDKAKLLRKQAGEGDE